jgi:D-tyrosyl-tRNA(Tyr) deacylase
MKLLVQRVTRATVEVDGYVETRISSGLVLSLGLALGDTLAKVKVLASKVLQLKLWPDLADPEKTFCSTVVDNGFEILVILQPSLVVTFQTGEPNEQRSLPSAEAKALLDAFVDALKHKYQEEMVVSAAVGAPLKLDIVNDGPCIYELDPSEVVGTPRASNTAVATAEESLEPSVSCVTDALLKLPTLSGAKATLESCRVFRAMSTKKFRFELGDASQEEADSFAEALDEAAGCFNERQQKQISTWTGLVITAPPRELLGADDGKSELDEKLRELHGEVTGKDISAADVAKARRPDLVGRAAPNTPFMRTVRPGAAPWRQAGYGVGARPSGGKGVGLRKPPGRSWGIASLDEAERLHGEAQEAHHFRYAQHSTEEFERVYDPTVPGGRIVKQEVPEVGKRTAPIPQIDTLKRLKGTPTVAPMTPAPRGGDAEL